MANKDVETKVVQVRFDNSKFSKNVEKTIKQCDELDKKLQFKNRSKDIKEVQEAIDKVQTKELNKELEKTDSIVHKITLGFKDLLKLKVLSRVMDTVINRTSALTKNLLGIKNVLAGWQQYEEQVTNVGGILNQIQEKTKADGSKYGLDDIADAMERLQWYTDETSFNFTTLSNGIRQFVVAGIDLNKAAEAAMGVTNLAGSAKVFDEYKIQSAMNAVSKAMQAGYMDLQKWTTLSQTAGIVTEDFSKALIEEAYAQGKLVKSAGGQYRTKKGGKLVTEENIASTLSQKWLNSNILTNVMNRYSSASTAVETFTGLMAEQTDESLQKINEMFKESGVQFTSFEEILAKIPEDIADSTEFTTEQAIRYLEKLGYEFDAVSLKALKSSQETTSFSQALKYVGDAIKTQWAGIFQSIFGDYDTATRLWSDVSNKFDNIFISPFRHLSATFKEWSTLSEGGAEDFRKTLLTIIDIIAKFKKSVSDAFSEVFGEVNASWLQRITIALKNFFESIKNNEVIFDGIKAFFKIVASVLKITSKLSGAVLKIIIRLLIALEPLANLVAELLGWLADGITWLIDYVDELGILDGVVEGLSWVLKKLGYGIKKVVEWIKGKVDLKKVLEGIAKAIDWIKESIKKLIDKIKEAYEATKKWVEENEFFQTMSDAYSKSVTKIKEAFTGFKESTDEAAEGLEKVNEAGEKASKKKSWMDAIKEAFQSLGEMIATIYNYIYQFLDKSGIIATVKAIIDPLITLIKNWFAELSRLAKDDPSAALKMIGDLILKIIGLLILLNVYWTISSGEGVIEEIWRSLKQFRKLLATKKWKELAKSLLYVSASIGILAITVSMIANMQVEAKKAWMAVGMISIFIWQYALILIGMNYLSKGFVRAIGSTFVMISTAIALSVFIGKLKSILKLIGGYTVKQIWTAMGILGALIGAFCVVMFTAFRKVETEWIIKKSGKIIGPGLFQMMKIMLSIFVFLKIALWFVNQVKDISEDDLKKAGIAFSACMGFFVAILASVTLLVKFVNRNSKFLSVISISKTLMSIMPILLIAWGILSFGTEINQDELDRGAQVLVTVIMAVIAICSVIAIASAVFSATNPSGASITFSKNVASLVLPIIACVAVFSIVKNMNLTLDEITYIGAFIIGLFVVIGLISIAINATSKVVSASIGKGGISVSKNKSPIFGALMSITFTVIAMVGTMKLLALIPEEEIQIGWKRLLQLLAAFVGATAILLLASKHARTGNISGSIKSIVIALAAIVLLAKLLSLKNADGSEFITRKQLAGGLALMAAIMGTFVVFNALLGLANRFLPMTLKNSFAVMVLALTILATIYGLIGAIKIMEELSKEQGFWTGLLTVVGMFAAVMIALITIVKVLKGIHRHKDFRKDTVTLMMILGTLVLAVYAMVGAVAIASQIPVDKAWLGASIVGVCMAVIIAMMFSFIGAVKMANKTRDLNKKAYLLMAIIGVMVLALLSVAGIIALTSKIPVDKAWLGASIVGVCMAVVITMIYSFLGGIKLMNKTNNLDKKAYLLMKIIGVMLLAVVTIATMVYLLSKQPVTKLWAGMAIVSVCAGLIELILLIFIGLTKIIKEDKDLGKNSLKLMMVVGLMIIAIYGIIGAIAIIASMQWQKAWLGMAIVGVIMDGLVIMIFALVGAAALVKKASMEILDIVLLGTIMAVIAISILAISAAMLLISMIPEDRVWPTFLVIAAICAVAILMMVAIILMAKKLKKSETTFKDVGVILLVLVGVLASILVLALAFQMLANIKEDRLWAAVKALIVMLTVITVIVAILAAIAGTGVGFAAMAGVALILVAISAAILGIAASIYIIAKAIDQLVNSFIKLSTYMSSKDPAKALEEYESACTQAKTASVNFKTALVNLGGAIVNFASANINMLSSAAKAIGAMFESAANKKKAEGVIALADAYDKLGKALDKINNLNVGYIDEQLKMLANNFKDIDKSGIKEFKTSINSLSSSINNFSKKDVAFDRLLEFIKAYDSLITNGHTYGFILMDLLNEFEYILDSMKDLNEFVITPMFDFSEFDAGLEYMRQNLAQYAYGYQSEANSVEATNKQTKAIQNGYAGVGTKKVESGKTVNVTINEEINDPFTMGYEAQRILRNAVSSALK